MKNPNEVLQQKEADLARVRHEVDTLKIVLALLADDAPDVEDVNRTSDSPSESARPVRTNSLMPSGQKRREAMACSPPSHISDRSCGRL